MARLGFTLLNWASIGFVSLINAQDRLDLGGLEQYEGKINKPSLTGDTVWISNRDDNGIDVALSDNVHAKVRNILEGCKGIDNVCYQNVTNTLDNSVLEIDNQLERRHFGNLMSKTFKKGSSQAFFEFVSTILISFWALRNKPDGPKLDLDSQFLDEAKAQQVDSFNGNVAVVAEGSTIVTITPTPVQTSLHGSVTPTVTPVTSAHNGFHRGDFVVKLDADLARRLDDIMARPVICKDGIGFPDEKRQSGVDYGAVICGTENAIAAAVPGGPLSDLLQMNPPHLDFAGGAARAAALVNGFAQAWAGMLQISGPQAAALSAVLFALAIGSLINKNPLGMENRIRQSLISGTMTSDMTTETSTSTSCSNRSFCTASCDQVGPMIAYCETSCKTSSGCATGPGTKSDDITTVTTRPYGLPTVPAMPTATGKANPDCSMSEPGVMQWSVFSGPQYSVADTFCQAVSDDPYSEIHWVVDSSGNRIPDKLKERSPPVTPDTYKDYKIALAWTPRSGFWQGSCTRSCKAAFDSIANGPCGHTSGQQNIMAKHGKWDIGCGTYSWHIVGPPIDPKTPLQLFDQQCYAENVFPDHDDIQESDVSVDAVTACGRLPETMGPGDSWYKTLGSSQSGDLDFGVEWTEGCVTDVDRQSVKNPLGVDGNPNWCLWLLFQDWKNCNNGGVGGWRNVGCLSYSFSPTIS